MSGDCGRGNTGYDFAACGMEGKVSFADEILGQEQDNTLYDVIQYF